MNENRRNRKHLRQKNMLRKIKTEFSVDQDLDNIHDSEHGHAHDHGHSHGQSHNIQSSTSLNSAIWMIVFGDGLHNFSDGLAIGASFASSLTTGMGTSLAVLFHELPHEIGDFAVLRKNGVSIKRAVLFNIVSSILCYIGVVIGLFIGSIEIFSQFSFLFIAGTFIYISLVDIVSRLFYIIAFLIRI